jgi:hypothetical protein
MNSTGCPGPRRSSNSPTRPLPGASNLIPQAPTARLANQPTAHPGKEPSHKPRRRPAALTLGALTALAIAGAVLPVLAGLAFLISLATRRPLIATAARRWPWLSGRPAGQETSHDRRLMNGLTAMWGIAMLAAGAAQGIGAATGRLTITDPASFTVRALIALAVEAVLTVITIVWLRRSPAANPPPGTAPV